MKKKIEVIIVDDNPAFCDAMQFMLSDITNINVIVYHNAVDFLNDHTSAWSGILLMDLLMPVMDGVTLLEELKKRKNNLYIIVISGHADKATANKLKEKGADEFLTKPFNVDYLLDKIDSFKSQAQVNLIPATYVSE